MKNLQVKRNLYIILATLVIFGVCYYLYLEVYAKNRERQIITTKSRILEQMSRGLLTKVNSLGDNAVEYAGHIEAVAKKEKGTRENFLSMLSDRRDQDLFNRSLLFTGLGVPTNKKDVPEDTTMKVKPQAKPDNLYYQVVIGKKAPYFPMKSLSFKISYDSLMSGLRRRTSFSEYILISDSIITFSTLSGRPSLTFLPVAKDGEKVTGSAHDKKQASEVIDLPNLNKAGQVTIRGVTNADVTISNKTYRLFACQIRVDQETWYLCGLVDADQIGSEKKTMAPWILITLSMVLVLVILAMPFIKLQVISPTERLTSGTLINVAISLFFGSCFIVLFIFSGADSYWYRNQNHTRLKKLAGEIDRTFQTEVKNAWDQLVFYDTLCGKQPRETMRDSTSILTPNIFKPSIYEYFDYLFWMDKNGKQVTEFTPFKSTDKTSDLSRRDYFNKPDEWILPGSDSGRFRLESIVSITSGIFKAAISKRSVMNDKVIAITGRFYSIIDPVLPADYKFCIIDGKGLVWFHSEKWRNLQENLVTECNGDAGLKAAMYANISKTLDVTYYDEPYRIHIQPIAQIPLYLVTMYDKQAEHSYQVQTLILTLILFAALVVFIVLEVLILFFLERFITKPGRKKLMTDFIGPKENHSRIYLVLSVLFLLITLLYILLTSPANVMTPLLSALVMITLLFPFSNYAINNFTIRYLGRNLFAVANLLILAFFNFKAFNLINSSDFRQLLIFEAAVIALLFAAWYVLQSDHLREIKGCSTSYYSCFLVTLIIAFSVVPSVKFFEATVMHEIIRETKHVQLELVRRMDARNRRIQAYYKLMEQDQKLAPAVETVFENRMKKGIYTGFIDSKFSKNPEEVCNLQLSGELKGHNSNAGEGYVNLFRPLYDKNSLETKYLGNDSLMNGRQYWLTGPTCIAFNFLSYTEQYGGQKPVNCAIITQYKPPPILNPFDSDHSTGNWTLFRKYNLLFILVLLLTGYAIKLLVSFGIRKIFGIAILDMHTEYDFGKLILERITSGQPVMVIGSPSVDPALFVKKSLDGCYDVKTIDLLGTLKGINYEDYKGEGVALVLDNFAADYYSQGLTRDQLKVTCDLLRLNSRVVIVSITAPYIFQEYLKLKANLPGDGKVPAKVKPEPVSEQWEEAFMSFNTILSIVNVLYTPEKYNRRISRPGGYSPEDCVRFMADYQGDPDAYFRCLIQHELGVSTHLEKFTGEMMRFYPALVEQGLPGQVIVDRIIYRIMEMNRMYYDNLIDSCTPLEKFVLSDMADDMIINTKNQKIIIRLIHRGFFTAGGCSIRFMNESFRKHILLRFNAEERARLMKEIGDTDKSWHGYKLFLILFLLGLLSFLFIANKDMLDNLNKLFLILGGGIVLISNISGLLTRKESGDAK